MKTQKTKRTPRRKPTQSDFWSHILHHRALKRQHALVKLLAGCEIIVALDGHDWLWE